MVHEFVSECQKGFVPDGFIAEATALLKLVEAYTNEEGADRKGILLFLDMVKAFDRVPYDFTLAGLNAFGFGKRFRGWVKMMYDTTQRATAQDVQYIYGYYNDEFQVKSGVAQGCPLSPLLFPVYSQWWPKRYECPWTWRRDLKGSRLETPITSYLSLRTTQQS